MKGRCWPATVVVVLGAWLVRGQTGLSQELPKLDADLFGRARQPGEVVRLDVSCTCGLPGAAATATIFGREVPLFPVQAEARWRGLIGIDLSVEPGVYPLRILVERKGELPLRLTQELRVTAKAFRTRRLRVLPRFVEPPAEEVERIQREATRLLALFDAAGPRLWEGRFLLPVSDPASSTFGSRSVFNGRARAPHSGVDFTSAAGTPIRAPATGTIVLAEDLFFTGNTVVIDHGLGLQSLMAHLSAISVAAGAAVTQGQTVGLVGETGRVTGPHLHWAVRLNGSRVDPLSLVAATE